VQRIFVVGCPRSGTTLLQSFLAAHPAVHAFPETHFFYRLNAARGWRRRLRLVPQAVAGDFGEVATLIGEPHSWWPRVPTVGRAATAFMAAADAAARASGRTAWVEKTPANLYAIDLIERTIPGARFLHVVRDGPDVVTSLCTVAGQWGRAYSVDDAVALWRECVDITAHSLRRPGHQMIVYAQLAQNPESSLRAVCEGVGLPYIRAMVEGRASAAPALIKDFEHWKSDNVGPLQYRPREKFQRSFDARTRRYILERLAGVTVPGLEAD
jgi:hypothetical protein